MISTHLASDLGLRQSLLTRLFTPGTNRQRPSRSSKKKPPEVEKGGGLVFIRPQYKVLVFNAYTQRLPRLCPRVRFSLILKSRCFASHITKVPFFFPSVPLHPRTSLATYKPKNKFIYSNWLKRVVTPYPYVTAYPASMRESGISK